MITMPGKIEHFADRTFGVEIELACCDMQQKGTNKVVMASNWEAKRDGSIPNVEPRDTSKKLCKNCKRHGFKYLCSNPFCIDETEFDWDGIEFISPILKGKEGAKSVKKFCNILGNELPDAKPYFEWSPNWGVDSITGLHIHIGSADLSMRQGNLLSMLYFLEHMKYRKMFPALFPRKGRKDIRRHCDFACSPVDCEFDFDGKFHLKKRPLGDFYFDGKQYAVNLMGLNAHCNRKTVEFREAFSSVEPKLILEWMRNCMQLVEFCSKVEGLEIGMTFDGLKEVQDKWIEVKEFKYATVEK